MVSDDDIDSSAAETGNRRNSRGPAVTCDYDLRSRRHGSVDSGIAQVIAILNAPGNKRSRLAPKDADHPGEDRRRANAVDVVVAVNENELLLPYRVCEPRDCLVH